MDIPTCTPASLPPALGVLAADLAIAHNPANRPPTVAGVEVARIGLYASKLWRPGTTIPVAFLEPVSAELRARILAHMNAWNDRGASIRFEWTALTDGVVRITREGDGYWSYLGTDVLAIPRGEPTLCLQSWTMGHPESEFRRVIRHEVGHTMGAPHEHLRAALVARLDSARTIAYFARTQGWDAETVRQQVLTPIPEGRLVATPADQLSIMTYQLPGECTVDGLPIVGGLDIDATDAAQMAAVYPEVTTRPDPPVPPVVPPPADGVPLLVVGGPAVDVAVSPFAAGRVAVAVPEGGLRCVVRADVPAPAWLPWLHANVAIVGPTGATTWANLPGGSSPVGFQAPGRYLLEIHYALPATARVRLLSR